MRVPIGFAAVLVVGSLLGAPVGSATAQQLELLTTGPTAGHPPYPPRFTQVATDGRHVFFETRERLVASDQDANCPDPFADDYPNTKIDCQDVYERFDGQTRLVSLGGNGSYDATLLAISSDGSRAFFSTDESLLPEDGDSESDSYKSDIYEWSSGTIELVSTGVRGERTTSVPEFAGASSDGSKVFFVTRDILSPADQNNCLDVYAHSAGRTTLVSTGPNDGPPPVPGFHCDSYQTDTPFSHPISSPDGAHFFFYSERSLVADDRDGGDVDLYERIGDETRLVSTGPTSGGPNPDPTTADFATAAPNGSRVFFATNDALVPEDQNTGHGTFSYDTYERDSSGVRLFAPSEVRNDPNLFAGPLEVSDNGERVYLWTNARLAPDDTDSTADIYERFGGSYSLVSTGPSPGPEPQFGGVDPTLGNFQISRDGERAFFVTTQRFVPEDTDDVSDIYQRAAGVTRLVSQGTQNPVALGLISPDGRRAYFQSNEQLVPEDTDARSDTYEWNDGTLSVADRGLVTAADAGVRGVSDDGRRIVLQTTQALTSDDTDNLLDFYAFSSNNPPDCSDVTTSRSVLWPANRGLRVIDLSGASDPDGDALTLSITRVTQDEPVSRRFDAARTSDPEVVRLRADRSPKGDGRVYRIAFTVDDGDGSCSGTVKVSVPRHQKKPAVDSAPPSYDSFGP
jgi:hypothetical protein